MSALLALLATHVEGARPSQLEGGLAPANRTEDLDALVAKLAGDNHVRRIDAVRGLAELDTPEAWRRVIGALADRHGEVADEAQLALAGLLDAVAGETLGSSAGLGAAAKEVRARAAEALGRVPAAVAPAMFTRFLGAPDADVRRLLAWSIERRARAKRVSADDVVKLVRALLPLATKDPVPDVRAAGLAALAELDPVAARPLVLVALSKGDSVVRCAAMASARVLAAPDPIELAKKHLITGPFALRAEALEFVGSVGTKPACRVLVDRLERETNLRLRWIAVRELQRLSGSDVELLVPFWKAWVEGLSEEWTFTPSARRSRDVREPSASSGPGTSQFLGLEIASESLAILIDLSGSIRLPNREGKVAKTIIDLELGRALDGFTKRTRFNLIPYGTRPQRWAETGQPATKENVAAAKRYFESTDAGGYGNLWSALELALADQELENVLILTDGHISESVHANLELLQEVLVDRLRFRKIAIDVLLVGARPTLQAKWRPFCESTGGRMLPVELK